MSIKTYEHFGKIADKKRGCAEYGSQVAKPEKIVYNTAIKKN